MKPRKQLIETLTSNTETASKLEEEFVRKGTAEPDQPPPVALAPEPSRPTNPRPEIDAPRPNTRRREQRNDEPAIHRVQLRQPLTPVTVRLRPELADALKRLSLQRQLESLPQPSQQEIIAEALQPLLRREGVL